MTINYKVGDNIEPIEQSGLVDTTDRIAVYIEGEYVAYVYRYNDDEWWISRATMEKFRKVQPKKFVVGKKYRSRRDNGNKWTPVICFGFIGDYAILAGQDSEGAIYAYCSPDRDFYVEVE